MDKDELRKTIKIRKRHFSRRQLEEMSFPVVRRLLENGRIACARTVMMYCSLPDEVDTRAALRALVAMGKRVVLPVVVDDCHMVLRQYRSDSDLYEGAYHIPEPAGCPFDALDTIDVVVVPGMAFDGAGRRLGRGKGYYDRFLPLCPLAWRIGVCFGFQLLPQVPAGPTDAVMDEVLVADGQ